MERDSEEKGRPITPALFGRGRGSFLVKRPCGRQKDSRYSEAESGSERARETLGRRATGVRDALTPVATFRKRGRV